MGTHPISHGSLVAAGLAVTGVTMVKGQHRVRIAFAGEIDIATAGLILPAVTDAVRDHRPRQVDIDLSAVVFMASSGITALLRSQAYAADSGCRLVVTNPAPMVHDLLQLTGLLQTFGIPHPRQ